MAVSSCLLRSWGASDGPKSPMRIKINTMVPPLKALMCKRGRRCPSAPSRFSVADSRVNDGIKSVDNKIDGDERHGVSHHQTGDQRIITGVERGDQQAAAARPGENR